MNLFRLFVIRVLPARTAKLSGLQAFGVLLLIFGGGVIAILALTTLQSNDFAHCLIPFQSLDQNYWLLDDVRDGAGAYGVAAFANREAQALFQRDRSDQRNFAVHVIAGHHHFHALR